MRFRRALLSAELAAPEAFDLQRALPGLEHLRVVASLPAAGLGDLFFERPAGAAPQLEALAQLRQRARAAAAESEVQLVPELELAGLEAIARGAEAEVLVAGSRSLRHAALLVEAGKRLGLPLLWPSGELSSASDPELCCVALGRRTWPPLAAFLRAHAAGAPRVSVFSLVKPGPGELMALLEIAGVAARVEVSAASISALPRWLEQRAATGALALIVLTRLPSALLLGLAWPAPVLLLPPTGAALLRHALDVTDVVDDGASLRLRAEQTAALGALAPVRDQQLEFVSDGRVVAQARTDAVGAAELPPGLGARALGVLRVEPPGPADAVAGVEQSLQLVRPDGRPLLTFDAELHEARLHELRGALDAGQALLAVRLRPTRPAEALRERLLALGLEVPVIDARAVLDEGPALDVHEANDPVRLARVARRLRRAGFTVTGIVHGGPVELSLEPPAPPCPGNRVEIEVDNRQALRWLLEAVAASRRSIHLQFYMVQGDGVGERVAAALAEAAARGVEVRLLADSLHGWHGSFGSENPLLARLAQQGVQVRISRPLSGLPSLADLKQRDHRKLVVVDGALALIGGRNLSREYFTGFEEVELTPRSGWREVPWLDAGARIQGPAVAAIEAVFQQAWQDAGGSGFEIVTPAPAGTTPLSVVSHRGLADAHTLETYLELIDGARSHITVVNGFPLMLELQHALAKALRRGRRVRVLTGHVTPTFGGRPFEGPWAVARRAATELVHSRLDALVEAGAEVFFFARRDVPGWDPALGVVHPHVHAKLMSVDGYRCCVGSANLDITSSYWESELMIVAEDPSVAQPLEGSLERLLAGSTRWDPSDPEWQKLALRRAWMRRWPGVLSL